MLLVALSLGAAFLIAEVVFAKYEGRLLEAANVIYIGQQLLPMDQIAFIKSANKKLVYELRPNNYIHDYVYINSHGFHNYEFTVPKPGNAYRIAVVGDSVTFGWGLSVNYTYPKVLECLLRNHFGPDPHIEVYNMAVDGYCAEQECELIRAKVLPLEPDLIVIGFCNNDFVIGADAGSWRHFTKGGSRTVDFTKLALMRLRDKHAERSMLERSYDEIARLTEAAGVSLLVVLLPDMGDTVNAVTAAHAEYCHALGLATLNLFDAFQGPHREEFFIDYLHLEPLGHLVAGEEILEYLLQNPDLFLPAQRSIPPPGFREARAHLCRGIVSQEAGEIEQALEQYRTASTLNPCCGRIAARNLRAVAAELTDAGKTDEAVRICQVALSLYDEDSEIHHVLGQAHLAAGRIDQAIAAYQTASSCVPLASCVLCGLARALQARGDDAAVEEAHEVYREAIRMFPYDTGARSAQVDLLLGQERFDEAVEVCRDALAFFPGDIIYVRAQFRVLLGSVLERTGREAEAAAQYSKILKSHPDFVEAYTALGKLLRKQGRVKEATRLFEKAAAVAPQPDYNAIIARIEALCALGEFAAAREAADEARAEGVYVPQELLEEPALPQPAPGLSSGG